MIKSFGRKCKHDYELIARVGGDWQATALKCKQCDKRKVETRGLYHGISYIEVLEKKIRILESEVHSVK